MNEWKEELARRLRAARGLESQGSLAGRSGVSDRTIGLIEQAALTRPPKPVTLARLAIATGRDPTEWLACAGLMMRKEDIDAIRDVAKVRVSMEQLEPPEVIKADLLAQVDARLRKFAPPEEIKADIHRFVRDYVERELVQFKRASDLWKDLTEYVDARVLAIERASRDLNLRIDHVNAQLEKLLTVVTRMKTVHTQRR